jgi:glycosyltransferase involved in cell wall biosynthesis
VAADLTIAAVIPLYNGRKFILDAIDSVLEQTRPPQDIIVVDDGSTDDGPTIVEQFVADGLVRLLRKENGGQSSARNLGVAHAETDLIALLDQDDLWYPDHLAELVKPFMKRKSGELGWVYSNLDEIDQNGLMTSRAALSNAAKTHPKRDINACLRQDMFVLPSASLISRAAFNAVGGFDERLSGYEDDDLFLRLFRAGYDNVWIDRPLSKWRLFRHSASWSSRMARSRSIYARKLVREFPDEQVRGLYYFRDLIAPRFLPQMTDEYKTALRSGQADRIRMAADDLRFIGERLPPESRHLWQSRDRTISAVIPLYNGERFIEEALTSLLRQTLQPDEIIVVDDGSTDGGPRIVERLAAEHPIRLLHKENGGQSAARNFGIAQAGGDLIALLDHDDAWYPNHLEELIKPFRQPRTNELGWAYSNLDQIDEDGGLVCRAYLSTLSAQHPKRDLSACLREDMFVLPSASLISRAAFNAVGGFDEGLSGYEDDDLLRAGYDNAYIEHPLGRWRMHPTTASHAATSRTHGSWRRCTRTTRSSAVIVDAICWRHGSARKWPMSTSGRCAAGRRIGSGWQRTISASSANSFPQTTEPSGIHPTSLLARWYACTTVSGSSRRR